MGTAMMYKYAKMLEKNDTKRQLKEEDFGIDDWQPNWSDNYRPIAQPCWVYYQGIIPKILNGKFALDYYVITHLDTSILKKLKIPLRYTRHTHEIVVSKEEFIILTLAGALNDSRPGQKSI